MDAREQTGNMSGEAEPDIDLAAIFQTIWRRRWLALGVAVTCLALGVLVTMRAQRIYRATALLLIEQSAPDILSDVREVYDLGSHGYWASREYYETQYNVIRSHPVAQKAALSLGLAAKALQEELRKAGPTPAAGRASGDALFELPGALRDRLELLGLHKQKSREDILEILDDFDTVQFVQGLVEVEPVKDSRLARVVIERTNPEHAARIANAVADAYIEYNMEQRITATRTAVDWLSDQVHELKVKLQNSELALHEFKKDNNIVSVSMEDRQTMIAETLSQLNMSLSQARARRIALESRRKRLQRAKEQDLPVDAVDEILTNSVVNELKKKLTAVKHEETELASRYTSEHPKLIVARQKRSIVESDLQKEIDNILFNIEEEFQSARDTEFRLRDAIEEVKAEALDLNKKEIDYNRLRRERDNNQALYDLVLKRQKETDLTQLLKVNNVRRLEAALPPDFPVRPRVRMNLAMALVLGVFLGIGVAFLVDFLDNTIKSQVQVEQRLGLPFLGILPVIKESKGKPPESLAARDQYIVHNPRSSLAECSRTIRTNLLFMSHERAAQKLLITSSNPQEGKTTTAINLAVTMAQSGKRTILVDTDMRRPRLHRSFEANNSQGISSVILGVQPLEQTIVATGVANLDLLPCGPIPPNPAELLHTNSFNAMVESLAQQYDRIVFDSPPLAAVSDSLVLGTMVDGVVLVLQAGKTTWPAAERAYRQLQGVGATIFGVVLNDVDLDDKRSGDYYQYYYYRAGYEQEAASES